MFKVANNTEIGIFVRNAIGQSRFPSERQFGKKCLELLQRSTDEAETRRMANQLSQILNGNQGIPLEYLPIFSKLLDKSCEEILSAGQSFAVSSHHVTNYSIALSDDKHDWEEYVNREDKLILNADEYGKTVIDYALEFKNYNLLKYLTDNKYIWFTDTDEDTHFPITFGAGTSIKRDPAMMNNINVLDYRMTMCSDLRTKMILLAIEHNDTEMLTQLRAKEMPILYQVCNYSVVQNESTNYINDEVLDALSRANDKVLEYFLKEFEITDRAKKSQLFIFPFLDKLIERLINTGSKFTAAALSAAVAHNEYASKKLKYLLDSSVSYYMNPEADNPDSETAKEANFKSCTKHIRYYDGGTLISYFTPGATDGIITNLIKIEISSDIPGVREQIGTVNYLYDRIQHYNSNL